MQRIAEVRAGYREALDDDLNLPLGIGLVFELLREANSALDDGRVGERGRSELLALIDEVDAHLDVVDAEEPGLAERGRAPDRGARGGASRARFRPSRPNPRGASRSGIALEDSKDGVRWKRIQAGPS